MPKIVAWSVYKIYWCMGTFSTLVWVLKCFFLRETGIYLRFYKNVFVFCKYLRGIGKTMENIWKDFQDKFLLGKISFWPTFVFWILVSNMRQLPLSYLIKRRSLRCWQSLKSIPKGGRGKRREQSPPKVLEIRLVGPGISS